MLQAVGAPKPSKIPEVTLGFWLIKILAATLGETGGDAVTMTWLKADVMVNNGYLIGSAIFISALIVLVVQISAKKFHPFLYWSVSSLLPPRVGDGGFCYTVFGRWIHRVENVLRDHAVVPMGQASLLGA